MGFDAIDSLFDQTVSDFSVSPHKVVLPLTSSNDTLSNDALSNDSDDLQILFDSVAEKNEALPLPTHSPVDQDTDDWQGKNKVFQRVGTMARQLHDTLCELGYDKLVEDTVAALPDAKDRLAYIANLTEQAACRVLNATDIANPIQEKLERDALALTAKWDILFSNRMSVDDFKQLATDTRTFLKQGLPKETGATKAQLLEIMMAQDFQDLTGQVIKKIIGVAQELESQLVGVLIETMPGECRTASVNSLINGPVINAEGRSDVVGNQQQVDDILDSLGF